MKRFRKHRPHVIRGGSKRGSDEVNLGRLLDEGLSRDNPEVQAEVEKLRKEAGLRIRAGFTGMRIIKRRD
jgi:hypothetical protein